MGFMSKRFLFLAATTCLVLCHLSIDVESVHLPLTKKDNCTDCCNFLACMGYDTETNNTENLVDFCSPINKAIMPTCYTKTNLEQCSYTKKLIPIMPSEDKLEEGFTEMCKHKEMFDEMKNITNCLILSGQSATIVTRCSTPYLNGLKDKTSDICDLMKTMTRCMVAILKATNCSETYVSFYEKYKPQMESNTFCGSSPSQNANACPRNIVNIGVLALTFIYVFTHKWTM